MSKIGKICKLKLATKKYQFWLFATEVTEESQRIIDEWHDAARNKSEEAYAEALKAAVEALSELSGVPVV